MDSEIKILTSKVFRNLYLRASENFWTSALVLIALAVVGIPLLQGLQETIRTIPYIMLAQIVISTLQKNLRIVDYIMLILLLVITSWLYLVYKQYSRTRTISDNFDRDLSKWSIPLNSGWTVQESSDSVGKMLSVTSSRYPGTLKGAYSWFDYEVSFLAKIDKNSGSKAEPNITIVIRSENNLNGIMLQITRTHFRPHIIYNGTFILDTKCFEQLPTVLKPGVWIKAKVIVRSNNVEVWIYGYKLQYKIPTNIYNVENRLLSGDVTLEDIESSSKKVNERIDGILQQLEINRVTKDEEIRKASSDRINELLSQNASTTKIILDFQKGSVGFREDGGEHTYFRSLNVKRID